MECNSATNADCKDKPEAITSFCQSETCYFRENIENVVSRGCLSVETEQSCVEDKDCTSCKDEQHCNIKQDTTPECFSCQGDGCSEIDFATQTRVKCNEGSKCITQLNNQGLVVRGCTQSAQEKCLDENTCKVCDGRLCNGEIFPTDRLKCIQCKSTAQGDECSLASEKFSRTCNIYNKEDQCFTYADERGLLYRGCASDKNQACTEDNCLKCSGDNCNTNGLQVPNKLKCIKCDSSKGEECEADKIKAEAVTCTGNHNLNERETCFVQKVASEDNKVTTKRGCFFELAVADQKSCTDSETCTQCGIDGCNKVDNFSENRGFKCYICNSKDQKDCEKENVPGVDPQTCPTTPNSFNEGPGCFVQRIDKENVIRDCKTSASVHDTKLDTCSVDKEEKDKNCIVCTGDSCNKMGAPGSASSIKVFGGLIALTIMFLRSL